MKFVPVPCITTLWFLMFTHVFSSTTALTMVKYERTEGRVCDKVTYTVYHTDDVPSCALLCQGSTDCSAFGYSNVEDSENCLLMSSDKTKEKTHQASNTGYHFYVMVRDSSRKGTESADNQNSWMRRTNGEIDFYRNWTEYKNGFGDHCEFWLGNDKLHELTKDGKYRLRIELEDNDGVMAAAEYETFIVGDEQSNYQLTLDDFNGANPPGDSMEFHNGQQFSTFDADNGGHSLNCASMYKGAWWYKDCLYSNLNGVYGEGITWYYWRGMDYSLPASRMMIEMK